MGAPRFDGEPLEHTLGFDAFQSNVIGARQLVRGSPDWIAREEMMQWGDVSLRPMNPTEIIWGALLGRD